MKTAISSRMSATVFAVSGVRAFSADYGHRGERIAWYEAPQRNLDSQVPRATLTRKPRVPRAGQTGAPGTGSGPHGHFRQTEECDKARTSHVAVSPGPGRGPS